MPQFPNFLFNLVWFNQRMVPKSSLDLGLWIEEGLLGKNTWAWDCNNSHTNSNQFAEKKCFVLCRSIWIFDRGKLVILSVFLKFHLFETMVGCHSHITKFLRRIMNEPGKIIALSVVTSSFKQIFKISQPDARVAEMCGVLCIVFEEDEEDFILMGMIFLIFCQPAPFLYQWMEIFGQRVVKKSDMAGKQKLPILVYLIATLSLCSKVAH